MKYCYDPHHVMLTVESSILMPSNTIFLGVNLRTIWHDVAYSDDFRIMSIHIVPSEFLWDVHYLISQSLSKCQHLIRIEVLFLDNYHAKTL